MDADRSRGRRRRRVAICLFTLLLAACGSSDSPKTGATCVVNTDCYSPLACSYGLCHEACREARDCPAGNDCVKAPDGKGQVCQLPVESTCHYKSECKPPLDCAIDRHCRTQCKADIDCATSTQKCVLPDGVCAEPADIDPASNKLKNAQATPVPDAPDGGTSDGGGVADAAGTPDGPMTGLDAASVDGPAPDLGGSDIAPGPCGFPDGTEPNDAREQATALGVGVPIPGCIADMDDVDYYELVAPSDNPAGGYFQVAVTDVGNGKLDIEPFTVSDNNLIHNPFFTNLGASQFFYFAAAPGQHYRVMIRHSVGVLAAYRYTVKADYTAIHDTYEPNDTRAQAKPIAVATPVSAYLFAGFTMGFVDSGHIGPAPFTDWYQVPLQAGMATFKLENAAGDLRVYLDVFDPLGQAVAGGHGDSGVGGAGAAATVAVTTPGMYFVQVNAFYPGSDACDVGTTVAPSFTMPYTLTVSQ